MSEPANQTGFLYLPHYIDVGDLLNPNYEKALDETGYIDPENLFFGDLDNLLSFSELVDLSTQGTARGHVQPEPDRPDRTAILDAVQRAEGTLDGYLARRYTVPLRTRAGTVPRDVYKYALSAFKYEMYSSWNHMPSAVEIQYQKVMTWLINIGKGLAVIPELIVENGATVGEESESVGHVGQVNLGLNDFGLALDKSRRPNEHRGFDY